jgi:serine/threonine-protein kinase
MAKAGDAVKTTPYPADQPRAHTDPFFCALEQSGLLPAEQVEELKAQYAEKELTAVSDQLVREQVLTPYQMRRLSEGQHSGLVLGPYHILEELGRGGFGLVYKARHTVMDRVVALKVIAPQWFQDAHVLELFQREVMAITRLDHPNIARAYDANFIDGTLYLAMEYVDGPSLEKRVKDEGPLPIPLACAVMHQTALTLEFAHRHGMVHRDIKPANLLLPRASAAPAAGGPPVLVKVVDFGLARLHAGGSEQQHTLRRDGGGIGTPAFMSPEQWRNVHDVDIRSDLYSLGCTFYFALTRRLPFVGETAMDTCAKHIYDEPIPPAQWRPEIPAAVDSIVRRLMAKKPEGRFATPTELAQALAEVLLSRCWEPANRSSGTVRTVPAAWDPAPPAGQRQSAADRPAPLAPSRALAQREPQPPQPESVRPLWGAWCSVVEGFAHGEPPSMTEKDYQALHSSLVAALRAGGAAEAGGRPGLAERLETVVEPWVNLRALADLDRTTLAGLWQTCRCCDAEFGPTSRGALGPLAWVALCILGGVLVSVVLTLAKLRPW